MKYVLAIFLLLLWGQPLSAGVCDFGEHSLPGSFLEQIQSIDQKLFTKVADVQVSFDGAGVVSVLYEGDELKAVRFTYTKDGKSQVYQRSIEELERGESISYENKDVPGKAMVLELAREKNLQKGSRNFNFLYRISTKPDQYGVVPVELRKISSGAQVVSNGKPFRSISMTPRIGLGGWKGTFKPADVK